MRKIITPENNNGQDWVVGKKFAATCPETGNIVVYLCDLYDCVGYWMTNVLDATDRRNVSERAINRTFWEVEDDGEYYWCNQWGRKIHKDGTNMPKYGEAGWTPRVTK